MACPNGSATPATGQEGFLLKRIHPAVTLTERIEEPVNHFGIEWTML
jgi:hypothetical protein